MPAYHPHLDENGKVVVIHRPHTETHPDTWHNSKSIATFVPNGSAPDHLNNVPIQKWDGYENNHGWNNHQIDPVNKFAPFEPDHNKYVASGIVMVEPDKRIWVTTPTNNFAGYKYTFPKGTHEPDSKSLAHTAIKEGFEETGLKAKITHTLGDYERTKSKCRMYVAHRESGCPTQMGWETQAMHLIPIDQAHHYIHHPVDLQILNDLKTHLSQGVAKKSIFDLFRK